MAEDEEQVILFRRILVAVDTSSHSRAALEAAAALAQATEAHLSGIFVEEEHWNRVGRFPFGSSVNVLTGRSETLEEERLQHRIEYLTKRLRRDLKQISRQHQINHSMDTRRGQVAEQILDAAKDADLITIGRRGRSFIRRNKLGSTAREVIRRANKPVLILKKGLNIGHTITVVYNATPQSQQALKMALRVAQKNDSKLSILVTDKDNQAGGERDKTVEQLVEGADIPVDVTLFHNVNVAQFLNAVNDKQSGLLVIPKNQSFLQGTALEITLEHIHCPVLLVM